MSALSITSNLNAEYVVPFVKVWSDKQTSYLFPFFGMPIVAKFCASLPFSSVYPDHAPGCLKSNHPHTHEASKRLNVSDQDAGNLPCTVCIVSIYYTEKDGGKSGKDVGSALRLIRDFFRGNNFVEVCS